MPRDSPPTSCFSAEPNCWNVLFIIDNTAPPKPQQPLREIRCLQLVQRRLFGEGRGFGVTGECMCHKTSQVDVLEVDRGVNAFGARRGQSVHTCRESQSQWSSNSVHLLKMKQVLLKCECLFNVIYWWYFVRMGLYTFTCLPEWAKYAFRGLINKWNVCSVDHITIHCLTQYPLGWEEVRGLDVSGQQHGTLWAGQNMNSWKLDSKKRRSVIPRHYWRVSQKRSQNTSIVITSGWEIQTCFRLWCKTNLQNGGRNYSMIPGHASLHLIRDNNQ